MDRKTFIQNTTVLLGGLSLPSLLLSKTHTYKPTILLFKEPLTQIRHGLFTLGEATEYTIKNHSIKIYTPHKMVFNGYQTSEKDSICYPFSIKNTLYNIYLSKNQVILQYSSREVKKELPIKQTQRLSIGLYSFQIVNTKFTSLNHSNSYISLKDGLYIQLPFST